MVKFLSYSFALISLLTPHINVEASSDEAVHHAPGFQIYQYDPKLKEALGEDATDSICWPSSLAHRMVYFKRFRQRPFPDLRLETDPVSNVQQFIRFCRTSLTGGTSQKRKLPCIRAFFQKSGYTGVAFAIGPAAENPKLRRPVGIPDLLEALRKDYGVILHVGWLKFDSKKHAWIERGSHSVNAYGFRHAPTWGSDRVVLDVSNPGVDYSSRASGQMYDLIEVTKLSRDPGVSYPAMSDLVLSGLGFTRSNRIAVLKDVFIFAPIHKR